MRWASRRIASVTPSTARDHCRSCWPDLAITPSLLGVVDPRAHDRVGQHRGSAVLLVDPDRLGARGVREPACSAAATATIGKGIADGLPGLALVGRDLQMILAHHCD